MLISRSASNNRRERDGESVQTTPHRTHAYAHFSREHLTRDDCTCGSRLSVLRVAQNHSSSDHVSLGCAISSVPFDFLIASLFSDATFRIIYTTYWNQKRPQCHSAVGWNVWPSGQTDLTQVTSPSSASMSVTSTRWSTLSTRNRNFTHEYGATVASTEDLDLPRHSGASSSEQGFRRVETRFIMK